MHDTKVELIRQLETAISEAQKDYGYKNFSKFKVHQFVDDLLSTLFFNLELSHSIQTVERDSQNTETLENTASNKILSPKRLEIVYEELLEIVNELGKDLAKTNEHNLRTNSAISTPKIVEDFFRSLPTTFKVILEDAREIYRRDPAAASINEVILTYPGFLATAVFRIANVLKNLQLPLIPRLITEYAHSLTGIDIHPGAQIGSSFAIDHGTGIVIGETAIIGNNVMIYQGVTLGAIQGDKSMASKKRHPTIENNVIIYSNATILGGETVIGENCIIGGNVWLTESVPSNSIVYHRSEVKVRERK